MFSGLTNPIPYLVAAYAIGVFCVFGLWFWVVFQRRRLERFMATLEQGAEAPGGTQDGT